MASESETVMFGNSVLEQTVDAKLETLTTNNPRPGEERLSPAALVPATVVDARAGRRTSDRSSGVAPKPQVQKREASTKGKHFVPPLP